METQSVQLAHSAGSFDPPRVIPPYLEPFIVEQDMSRYTAVDQAVWRFVLLQLQSRLQQTAHASYRRGLAQSSISAEHVPSITEMNRTLGEIGWSAVCVDGFIPPRAFTAFQALGVLPIAAEIRSVEHLPYTPAPDIIHEAAGHAPILVDPRYAAYLRAAGEVASRAFSNPRDARVDAAIRVLSDLKERLGEGAGQTELEAAETELERAVAAFGEPSEAARLARLYWWTAEYGLVGTLDDYRLYGAGLLSSLGESHFCHEASVRKLPLSAACTSVGYDITKPQPQLFVARDFEHLHDVLAEVADGLAYRKGGDPAVRLALDSQETCTLHLGDFEVIGTLSSATGDARGRWLTFSGVASVAQRTRLLGQAPPGWALLVGPLSDGGDPRRVQRASRIGDRVMLVYASGARVEGRLVEGPWQADGVCWLVEGGLVDPRGRATRLTAPYPLLLVDRLLTASAGSVCPDVSPLGEHGARAPKVRARVPKPRAPDAQKRELARLYEAVASQRSRAHTTGLGAALAALYERAECDFPHEWLLRWNLLECLAHHDAFDTPLARRLRTRLFELEVEYAGRYPIASGVHYLEDLARLGLATPVPANDDREARGAKTAR